MESKKINQLATNVNPQTSDLTTIGDPITGQLKKITWLQVAHLIGAQASVTLQQVTDNGNTTTDPITTAGLTLTNLGTGVPQLTNGNFAGTYGYGLANGVATLDSGGKIPASQLPSSVMEYKGTWNASTNTPTLADGTGDNGDVYLVNVAGSQNLGSGTISFAVGDWVVYNGTIWQKSLNSNAVASVFGRTGTIVAQEGDYNIDQLGDVAITSAATNDYLRYNGSSWVNTQFPTFVSSDKLVLQVRNNSGATINKGTVVYINGATAGYPTIAKAQADADATSAQTIGMVQDNISNNSNGVVVIVGQITGVDTSAYTAGTQLYLSGTTAGAVTSTKTLAPTHLVYVGIVTTQNAVNGVIEVKIQNGYELDEIHDVAISSVANNQGLFYESSTSLWKNKSIETVLGYTPEQPLTFSSPLVRTTNTISIPAATGSVDGYLTSTDWTTFNNKQNALTNPITGTGTTNTLPKFTGATTLGNSNVTDDNNSIILGINTRITSGGEGLRLGADTNGNGYTANTAKRGRINVPQYGTPSSLPIGVIAGLTDSTSNAIDIGGIQGGYALAADVIRFNIGATYNASTSSEVARFGSNGALGIGTTSLTGFNLRISKNITGATTSYGITSEGTIQSDVTGAYYNRSVSSTAAASFTLSNLYHYAASQGSIGAGSTVTNQFGFNVLSSLTGATNNYGFYGNLAAATNTWNLYMNGTANNYMAGALGFNVAGANFGNFSIRTSSNITGNASDSYGIRQDGTVASDVTTRAYGYSNTLRTQAATFTLTNYYHYDAGQATLGSGSVVTNQTGFWVQSSMIGATNNFGFRGDIPSGTNRWNLYMNGTADNYLAGSLGIGSTSLTGYNLRIAKTLTGGTSSYGIEVSGAIQSDVTNFGILYSSYGNTQSANFTLTELVHYYASSNSTFPNVTAGGAVTNQYGFNVTSSLTGATNNYGFFGNIASGTGRWNLYMNGTANNYMAGSLGIGTTSLTGYNLRVAKTITGATNSYGVTSEGVVQSDVTSTANYFLSVASTQAASFTLSSFFHYRAQQGTIGASSTVTNQWGFAVDSTLIGATNNYGFRGAIPSGTNRWNLYMDGTANNYMAGALGIGSTSLTGRTLYLSKTLTGSTNSTGIYQDGVIQSDVTANARYFDTYAQTQATAFTLTNLSHYRAGSNTFGAGSTVTNQYGFFADATVNGATNNYGFYGNIASGTNRWNLYMNGTANNYLAGSLGIGNTSLTGINLRVQKDITGGTAAYGVIQGGTVLSDVTSQAWGFNNSLTTQASAFTLTHYYHYASSQSTIGATSAVTNQYGFYVFNSLTGATNNYGFYGNLASASNVWNLYMNGTAANYLAGSLNIGTTSVLSDYPLNVQGTVNGNLLMRFANTSSGTSARLGLILNTDFGTLGSLDAYGTAYNIGSTDDIANGVRLFASGAGGLSLRASNASGTIRFYNGSTESARFGTNGALGIGSTSLSIFGLRLSKTITGGTIAYGQFADGAIQSDVTSEAMYYSTNATTAASAFTLTNLFHFRARYNTFGATSAVTNQYGFYVDSALTAATNNFGFYGNISSGANRWNLYMNGTAANYLAGNLSIGTTSSNGRLTIQPANDTVGISVSGSSLTGTNAQSLLDLSQTWNTTGYPTAIKLNITNTASGILANLMDLQVGGTTQFLVDKAGAIKTSAPSGGTAGKWKLGSKVTATVALVTTDYIELEVDGVAYKVGLVS